MTIDELRSYSLKHLYYEVWMLQQTGLRLLLDGVLHGDQVVKNALVESFTVHARAVTAFLYPEQFSNRPGDVTCDDYVRERTAWETARMPWSEILQEAKSRTGKEIAHLTTDRLEYDNPDREWPLIPIFDALRLPLRVFVSHTPSERLDQYVAGYIIGLQSLMPGSTPLIYGST